MKKSIIVAVVLLCALCSISAEGVTTRSVSVAYQTPAVGMISGTVAHAVPCLTGDGSNPLLAGNNLTFTLYGEVTPITAGADFSAALTPFPVVVLAGGVYTGSGWTFMGIKGIGAEEDHLPLYYKPYAKITLQMDTGALIPGDWTHVLTQCTYQVQYENLAGLSNGSAFTWLGGNRKALPGWYANALIGYQLPAVPVVDIVACQGEWEGNYADGYTAGHANVLANIILGNGDNAAMQLRFDLSNGFESAAIQYTHNF